MNPEPGLKSSPIGITTITATVESNFLLLTSGTAARVKTFSRNDTISTRLQKQVTRNDGVVKPGTGHCRMRYGLTQRKHWLKIQQIRKLMYHRTPEEDFTWGAADATLNHWDGAYPRGIHKMSHIPRHIEASAVGSHVKSAPEIKIIMG